MRRLMIGVVVLGVAVVLTAPAFATGKQVICWQSGGENSMPFWGSALDGIRFQTLIDQAQINYKGRINQVEFHHSSGVKGTFYAYKLILCHCRSTDLSDVFVDNYKGTPVTVATLSSFNTPGARDWFGLGMTTTTFDYNNTDHLLIEIQWKGDNGVRVPVYTGRLAPGNHRVWAYNDPNATTGYGDKLTYFIRLSFGAYTAVTPTSLGRVKALYE